MQATVLITGASSGIGRAAAIESARRGARVIATGRSAERLRSLAGDLRSAGDAEHRVVECDQSSLATVAEFAAEVIETEPRLDVLVANAGVQPARRTVTVNGLETTMAVNHYAHFLLAWMLAPLLIRSSGRLVVTSSSSHGDGQLDPGDPQLEHGWTAADAYGRSKRANLMFAGDARERLGVPTSAFHPGDILTDINREARFVWLTKPFERFKYAPARIGAQTLVWLMFEPEGADPRHLYYVDRAGAEVHSEVLDAQRRAWLWDESVKVTGPFANRRRTA